MYDRNSIIWACGFTNYGNLNIGDGLASPMRYLVFGGRLTRFIDLAEWDGRGDVIIGGGGMLLPECEESLKRLSGDSTYKRIVWGVGTNYAGIEEVIHPEWLKGFDLVGLRDKEADCCVPCASCLHPEFDAPRPEPVHDAVVYSHGGTEIPITAFPTMHNYVSSLSMWKVLDFLASGKVVITNSYHGCYWATMLGRKVICWHPNSNRFFHMPWAVSMCMDNDWENLLGQVLTAPNQEMDWLGWSRNRNLEFYIRAKALLAV